MPQVGRSWVLNIFDKYEPSYKLLILGSKVIRKRVKRKNRDKASTSKPGSHEWPTQVFWTFSADQATNQIPQSSRNSCLTIL